MAKVSDFKFCSLVFHVMLFALLLQIVPQVGVVTVTWHL